MGKSEERRPPESGREPGENTAVAGLIMGIAAVVFWFFGYSAVASVVLGILGLVWTDKAKKEGYTGDKRTIAFVLSLVFGVLTVLGGVGVGILISYDVFLDGGDFLRQTMYEGNCVRSIDTADSFLRGTLANAGVLVSDGTYDYSTVESGDVTEEERAQVISDLPRVFAEEFSRDAADCHLTVTVRGNGEVVGTFENFELTDGDKPLYTTQETFTYALNTGNTAMVTIAADLLRTEEAPSYSYLLDMWLVEHTALTVILTVLFAALATGGAVVVSQYLGAKEQEKANASAGQLILLSAILGTVVAALCILFARPMISACYGSIDADVLDAGVLYLKITALSYPFLALYNAGAALFRSMGNSKISMQISVLMNIINIVGNAVCIFGLKMGVDGVAWPSVVSRVIAAVLILGRCYQKGHALTVPKTVKLDTGMAKRILGIGVPSAFENSLFEAGRIVVVSMISTFGTVQIAANAVANNLDGVGCIPGKASGLAMITVVGRCIGAGDNEQAVYYTKKLLGWAYLVMGVLNGLILIFVRPLVGIYELSGETMELSIILACIHAGFAMLLWPLSFVLPNALRAANDVKFTMIVSIASMACWRVGFSYIIGVRMGMGAIGVWIAMVVDWVCRVTCFVTRFRSGVWKEKYKA